MSSSPSASPSGSPPPSSASSADAPLTGRANPRRCVCPGSYDPVTNGHLDVVARAVQLFDEVVVGVLVNPAKHGMFQPAERLELIHAGLAAHDGLDDAARSRITVRATSGVLLVDFCREVGAVAVVKGLRSATDFAYELPMALMNRHLSGLETLFLAGDPQLEHVSSSLVKEVFGLGGDIRGMVPGAVLEALARRRDERAGR